ncbi:MAG: hypothetical protein GY929_20305 [Actinomycetia bacterium]|nr:hypothetical protein [Actinomycetes bacterium]
MTHYRLAISDLREDNHQDVAPPGPYATRDAALVSLKSMCLPPMHAATIQEYEGDKMTAWHSVNMQTMVIAQSGKVADDRD